MLIQISTGDFLTRLSAMDEIPTYLNIFIGITLIVGIVYVIKKMWNIRKRKDVFISDSQPNPTFKYPTQM